MISRMRNIKRKVVLTIVITFFLICFGTNIVSADGPTWSDKDIWDISDDAFSYYSAPVIADLDNDGDYDVLIGDNEDMCYAFKNTGSASSPTWTRESDWDITISLSGVWWTPAIADLDDDGDYDVLVGNMYDDKCYGYNNTGTASSPAWTRESDWDFTTGLDLMIIDPALADLDNDGDYDVIIGEEVGACYAFKNTGSASSPTWTRESDWDIADMGDGDQKSAPTFGDLDKDGDYDLLIGNGDNCYAYENTGSISSPTWTRNSDWDGIFSIDNPQPALADLDNDGDNDILIGEYDDGCFGIENTDPTPPVPESSTLILIGFGLIALVSYVIYTKKK